MKADPLLVISYAIGAVIFYELWNYQILTADLIWKILSGELR